MNETTYNHREGNNRGYHRQEDNNNHHHNRFRKNTSQTTNERASAGTSSGGSNSVQGPRRRQRPLMIRDHQSIIRQPATANVTHQATAIVNLKNIVFQISQKGKMVINLAIQPKDIPGLFFTVASIQFDENVSQNKSQKDKGIITKVQPCNGWEELGVPQIEAVGGGVQIEEISHTASQENNLSHEVLDVQFDSSANMEGAHKEHSEWEEEREQNKQDHPPGYPKAMYIGQPFTQQGKRAHSPPKIRKSERLAKKKSIQIKRKEKRPRWRPSRSILTIEKTKLWAR